MRDGDILQSRFLASKLPWGDSIALRYGWQTIGSGWMALGKPPLVKVSLNESVEPFMEVTTTEAQTLMDTLWECGLRPSEGTGSAGALAATQRHLEDMRSLVFKKLKP